MHRQRIVKGGGIVVSLDSTRDSLGHKLSKNTCSESVPFQNFKYLYFICKQSTREIVTSFNEILLVNF